MNVTINVDLTPSEARELMGLPDVKPLHDAALARVEQSVMAQADKFSAAGLMDTWFAGSPRAAELFSDMVGGLLSQGRAREKPAAKSKDAIREQQGFGTGPPIRGAVAIDSDVIADDLFSSGGGCLCQFVFRV
jgi:hypothetical protein